MGDPKGKELTARDQRVRVVTAAEAAARDAAAIAAGVPSRALMQRAGAAAAAEIARRFPGHVRRGVVVHAGPGNNGGDAWVVAAALARAGVPVAVEQHGGDVPHTADARYERERALASFTPAPATGREALVVDGLLGTGARGALRGWSAEAVGRVGRARAAGAAVVALDVPSGLDATSGEPLGDGVGADATLTFGTLKRGLLVARDLAGEIAVLDIGLGPNDDVDDAPRLATAADVRHAAPPVGAAAHKGTRGKVVVVGGAPGMAGAAALATDAALRSGAGMVRAVVAPPSVAAVQHAAREALASQWPADAEALSREVTGWADAVLIGPGLGRGAETRALCDRVLAAWRGPVVLDADALNVYEGDADALARLLRGRAALVTPHPLEFARLADLSLDDVLARRFDVGVSLAASLGATVLLKGVPTVVTAPNGERVVVARGTPALAAGGSGDVLAGIAAALAGGSTRATADAVAIAAAWVHGRAAEVATARRGGVRGTTLADILGALGDAWPRDNGAEDERPPYPVIAELPRVPT